jgi:hypothetical protein
MHCRWQGSPTTSSRVHACLSSQLSAVGQSAPSHNSPVSRLPLPHTGAAGGQSASMSMFMPFGQQPSGVLRLAPMLL